MKPSLRQICIALCSAQTDITNLSRARRDLRAGRITEQPGDQAAIAGEVQAANARAAYARYLLAGVGAANDSSFVPEVA